MEQPKQVGIWIRVSTDMQVKDESPEHHEQRARTYADLRGWQVVEVYRLDAVSGKAVMHHPETQRMLKDVRSGHIEGLVFSKLARLARSTKELLEFAEIFRKEKADLISLAEQIDTSSPAGRLFFTIISAMAEWEREEISSRVAASVPIRAQMGKPLGGQASYGYAWHEKQLVVDEKEAPIRRLMYEIFLKTQRKQTTANELNALGYRTRNGSNFSDNTVDRLLRDTTAKGERKANYTKSLGDKKQWIVKPESEWIITPCPAIVTEELWAQVNSILIQQEQKNKKTRKKAVYLLSGYIQCECGKTMYVFHNSKVYACKTCKSRIAVDDIDEIYQTYLTEYLQGINASDFLAQSDSIMKEKSALLAQTLSERKKLAKKFETFLEMRLQDELSKEQFAEHCQPINVRIAQLDTAIPELQAECDFLSIQLLSSDTVLDEAQQLSNQWQDMQFDKKRAIVETITDSITIRKEDIDIALCFLPSSFLNAENNRHNFRGS
jgi:site-specific DNA recombinase